MDMNIEMRDGRVLSGTPLQIVRQMKELAFGVDELSFAQYVAFVVQQAQRFESVDLDVKGSDDSELAKSLVDEMTRTGLARAI
jgi:hypothetical protein